MSDIRSRPRWTSPWAIIAAACLITGLAMSLRQVLGLYLRPVTMDLGIGREPFSNAMAIANLVWGFGAILFGFWSDRFGAARVAVAGVLCSMVGFWLITQVSTGAGLIAAGVLLGLGSSGSGVTALVGAVGRAVPAEQRTAAIASLGMATGIATFLAYPYVHVLIEAFGWRNSLLMVAATVALTLPLTFVLAHAPKASGTAARAQTMAEAFREAFATPSFWLLTFGFFVCGFHVAFYSVHIPAFVQDQGLGSWVGVWALMAVGIGNIIGTWLAGQSGRFFQKRTVLCTIYFARAALFIGLLILPITPLTIIGISALLGLFWLSTIPLTSGLVATFFGTHWMSMLFGFVFLSHQLGSFLGLVLAGKLYDATHSYNVMWWISAGLGLAAGLLNMPIKERPVPRLLAAAAAE
jgi:predicted MFS family arabinose efflux permease